MRLGSLQLAKFAIHGLIGPRGRKNVEIVPVVESGQQIYAMSTGCYYCVGVPDATSSDISRKQRLISLQCEVCTQLRMLRTCLLHMHM